MEEKNYEVLVIDLLFKTKFENQLKNNRYLKLTPEKAEKAYGVIIGYLEDSPEERGTIKRAEEVIEVLTKILVKYSASFMSTFLFLYNAILEATDTEKRIRCGRAINIMLFAFCGYINGLSK